MVNNVAIVCDRHRVARGGPADLASFLRALSRNKHLAMDFWSVVTRMSGVAAGQSEVPDWRARQEMTLEAIVRAIAGLGVSETAAAGADSQLATTHMASLLAGADIEYETASGEVGRAEASRIEACGMEACGAAQEPGPMNGHGDAASRTAETESGGKRRKNGAAAEAGRAPAGLPSSRVWIADEAPAPPMGNDEFRRLVLGPADRPGALPPGRATPRRRGKARIVGCALLLMAGCGAVLHAQRSGSLGRYSAWIRGVAGAVDGR
jgi:hypothetical protein